MRKVSTMALRIDGSRSGTRRKIYGIASTIVVSTTPAAKLCTSGASLRSHRENCIANFKGGRADSYWWQTSHTLDGPWIRRRTRS